MNEEISLSRIQITGRLGIHTPNEVLQEIAMIHKLHIPPELQNDRECRQKLIREINRFPYQKVQKTPREEDLPKVVKFVNPFVDWPVGELIEAFSTLKIYMGNESPLPNENFTYGLQIPTDPYRLNVCVLYKICRAYSLPVRAHHTASQLATAVRMLIKTEEESRALLGARLRDVKLDNVPSVYLLSCKYMETIPEEGPSNRSITGNIEAVSEIFDNPEEVLFRIIPQNRTEAIVLAAKNFEIDLTECGDPVREYKNILEYRSVWIPLDYKMRNEMTINPMAFCLKVYFNPSLPHQLYDQDNLSQLAFQEGYTSADLRNEGAYSLLQTAVLSPTFYHGKYSTITNKRTPIALKRVQKLTNNSVVCFGTLRSSLIAFSYEELAGVIFHAKNFINPLSKDHFPFPDLAVRKLKKMVKIIRGGETKIEAFHRRKLLRAVELAELFTNEENVKIRDFYIYYDALCKEDQTTVVNILQAFLHLAMYARAWNPEVDEEYPIEISMVNNQSEVDIRVTEGIAIFERLCEENEEIGNIILDLPLLKYRGGWQFSTRPCDGKTIRDRLIILKEGEDHEEQVSCIRLTSNWFAASAYRYMVVIGLNPPFDIENLRFIS